MSLKFVDPTEVEYISRIPTVEHTLVILIVKKAIQEMSYRSTLNWELEFIEYQVRDCLCYCICAFN